MAPGKTPPEGTKKTNGILHYDNFPDGLGLYYASEGYRLRLWHSSYLRNSCG